MVPSAGGSNRRFQPVDSGLDHQSASLLDIKDRTSQSTVHKTYGAISQIVIWLSSMVRKVLDP